jgi:hypothetical protein
MWEFRNSHLGVLGQNAIWMWPLWRSAKYTIRGKVMASPKSEPWWVLWIRVCPWFVLAPKVPKLCTNQIVVWFVQIHVSDWKFVILLSPIKELQHAPLPPKCCKLGSVPWLLVLPLFTSDFQFEFIKEPGSMSRIIFRLKPKLKFHSFCRAIIVELPSEHGNGDKAFFWYLL